MLRSILFVMTFYVTTALFLLGGSWLFFAPRSWAMAGLKAHAVTCVWLMKWITGTKLEVRGHEKLPKEHCLVVAKHQSAWDTFGLIPLFRDPAIVLKEELKWIPFYGWFCVKFEHILVRRERASVALKKMIADARDRLDDGREVVIFPEGSRRAPGAEPDYKPGYVALYENLGVTCVPVALNSGVFWPRRSWLRRPGTIVVEFLDPIPPGLMRKEFKERVETAIEDATKRLVGEGES